MVSINRLIIRRIKNGRDLATYRAVLVPPYSSLSSLNNFVASIMLLKESVDMEINASIWFRWIKKKTSSLIEDKRKDKEHRVYTRWNPIRHIPPVSLMLWRKMVTVCCFVWALGLRLWSVSETKFRVLTI